MLPRFLTHGTSKVMRDQEGELDPITLFPEKFPLFEVPLVLLDLNFSNNKLPIRACFKKENSSNTDEVMYTLRTGHKLQNGLLCILRVYNKVYCNIFLFVRHGIFCCPYLHEKALLGILKIYLHVSEKKKNAHYLPETTSSDFLQKRFTRYY